MGLLADLIILDTWYTRRKLIIRQTSDNASCITQETKWLSKHLTPLSRVLLPHTVNKFPCCMEIEHSYRIHISLPIVTILFNILLPSTPRPSKWVLSLRFSHQNAVCNCHLLHTCHMPRPSHFSCFYYRNILWRVEITKLFIMQSSPLPSYLICLRPKCLPPHPKNENLYLMRDRLQN